MAATGLDWCCEHPEQPVASRGEFRSGGVALFSFHLFARHLEQRLDERGGNFRAAGRRERSLTAQRVVETDDNLF